jgi:hypothetical protein
MLNAKISATVFVMIMGTILATIFKLWRYPLSE